MGGKTTVKTYTINNQSGPIPIAGSIDAWTLLTIVAHSAGALLGMTGSGIQNNQAGLPIPIDTPLEILVAPGSRLFIGTFSNSAFSVIQQPLPFIAQIMLTAQRLFGLRSAA